MAERASGPDRRGARRPRAAAGAVAGLLLLTAPAALAQDAAAPDPAAQLLTMAQSELSLATLVVEQSDETYRKTTMSYDAGTATFMEVLEAQLAFLEADKRLKFAQFDVYAIETAGAPVRMEVAAPLVGGRDLVSERLQIEFDLVARRASALEEAIKFTEARVQAGAAAGASMTPLTTERAQLAVAAEQIRLDLAQRQAWLAGGSDIGPAPSR